MQISAGDTLSLEYEPGSGVIRLTKATIPLDMLADEAQKDFQAGKTMDFREYTRKSLKVSESLSRIHAAVKDSGASSATVADAIREVRSRQPK